MSDNANQNQAVSDDQELAKVLQGMQQQARSMATSDPQTKAKDHAAQAPAGSGSLQYEETPKAEAKQAAGAPPAPARSEGTPAAAQQPAQAQQQPAQATNPPAERASSAGNSGSLPTPAAAAPARGTNPGLESLKKEALEELRPLVDKLDLPPKEKFDTMLLIIRSTDDQELLQPAHEAAKEIEDENQRAEALLDIVKEVDYFSSH